MQSQTIKIILATIIVFGGFALFYFFQNGSDEGTISLEEFNLPESFFIDEETEIKFEWTDDNTGEDLIIQSDKATYFGVNESVVYFTITNINTKDQEINVRYLFEDDQASLKNIERINTDQSISNLTSVTRPTVRFKNMRGFTSSANYYLDNIKSGETNYYQATINYPPNSKGEFYVEAKGNNGAYGLLDPFYDSSGLVGYWSFNGEDTNWGTNTTNDLSGQGNHGTMTNMSITTSPTIGRVGQALSFDGTNDYIYNPNPYNVLEGPTATVSLWVKRDRSGQQEGLINFGSGSQIQNVHLQFDAGNTIYAENYNNVNHIGSIRTGQTITDNEWHNIIYTYDDSTSPYSHIYVDGVEDNSPTRFRGSSGNIQINDAYGTYIGSGFSSVPTVFFDGSIDEVLIYNKALTQPEITQLYNTGKSKYSSSQTNKLTDGLVLMQSFDGADIDWGTNTAYDRSGQGNNGTMTNMSQTTSPTDGMIGQALEFDGSDDYIEVGDTTTFKWMHGAEDTSNFKVSTELWMKLNVVNPDSAYVLISTQAGSSANVGYEIYYDDRFTSNGIRNEMAIFITRGVGGQAVVDYRTNASVYPSDTDWHHVVTTYDQSLANSNARIYIDGVLVGTGNKSIYVPSTSSSTHNLHLGSRGSETFLSNASIDEVRIYNRALSQSEITQLYNTGKATHSASQTNNLTDGLVLMQSFDGADIDWGTNTAYDRSGQGNNGTMTNMSQTTSPTDGMIGQALEFDGTGDWIDLTPNLNGVDDYSVSAWFNWGGVGINHDYIYGERTSGLAVKIGFYIFGTDDLLYCTARDSSNHTISANWDTVPTIGEWYHAVCVIDNTNNQAKIYINGVLEDTGNITIGSITNATGADIGNDSVSTNDVGDFSGKLDEVRVYNRLLTQSEITQLYNMGKSKISN